MPKICYQRMFTLSNDQSHPIDLNWACQMKKFFNVLDKAEIWLRQDPEEIRRNIKSLTGELEAYYFKEGHNRMVDSSLYINRLWPRRKSGNEGFHSDDENSSSG